MKTAELVTIAEGILRISISRVGNRYMYRADETDEWYRISVKDIRYAITLSRVGDEDIHRDLYTHWCSATGRRCSARMAKKLDAIL